MNIAIDIDDTIYVASKKLDKITRQYLHKNKIKYIFNNDKYQIHERYKGLIIDNNYLSYLRHYIKYIFLGRINHKIIKYIKKLIEDKDNTLYFFTRRSNEWFGGSSYDKTFKWLMKYLNKYRDKIFLYADVDDKGSLCRLLNCNVLIDNDIHVLIKAKGLVDYRIKMTLPSAIDESFFIPDLYYCNSWKEAVLLINKIRGESYESN